MNLSRRAGTRFGVAQATAIVVALCFFVASPALAEDETPAPTAPIKGEFGNACVMSLAEGHPVVTDCTVNWTNKDGKVYCFSTEAARTAFLVDPTTTLQKAKEFVLTKDLAVAEAAASSTSGGTTASSSTSGAAASGPTSSAATKEFTEDDVNAAVKTTMMRARKTAPSCFTIPSSMPTST